MNATPADFVRASACRSCSWILIAAFKAAEEAARAADPSYTAARMDYSLLGRWVGKVDTSTRAVLKKKDADQAKHFLRTWALRAEEDGVLSAQRTAGGRDDSGQAARSEFALSDLGRRLAGLPAVERPEAKPGKAKKEPAAPKPAPEVAPSAPRDPLTLEPTTAPEPERGPAALLKVVENAPAPGAPEAASSEPTTTPEAAAPVALEPVKPEPEPVTPAADPATPV